MGELWRRGTLRYALHADQRRVQQIQRAATGRVFVLECSRRWGKSVYLVNDVNETAITVPKARIKYAAPTMKMAREIVAPLMQELHEDCPRDMRPRYHSSDLVWEFPHNKSRIVLAGCDNGNADRLRGTGCDRAAVDESGFVDDLRYLIQSILLPQMMTTGGSVIMASSPARTPAHDFTGYCVAAEAEGRYAHRTVYDAPHLTPAVIEEFCRECGGEESTDWKREYLAQRVVDESIAVLPEFTRHLATVVGELERPPFFHALTSIDAGFEDLTAALFGYHDFMRDALVIEDELVFHRANSGTIAPAILAKEQELWGGKEPQVRVMDADAIVRADMSTMHGLHCRLPRKDDKSAQVNALRVALPKHVIVHPRCKALIAHCKGAVWNKQRTSFERAEGMGHYDFVDALVYMWRHTDRQANPYPAGYGINRHTQWAANAPGKEHALAGIVKPLRRR